MKNLFVKTASITLATILAGEVSDRIVFSPPDNKLYVQVKQKIPTSDCLLKTDLPEEPVELVLYPSIVAHNSGVGFLAQPKFDCDRIPAGLLLVNCVQINNWHLFQLC